MDFAGGSGNCSLEHSNENFDCGGISNIIQKQCFKRGNEEFQFIEFSNAPGIAYRRILYAENTDVEVEKLLETVSLSAESPLSIDSESFCFHAENTRIYERFVMPVFCDRTGSVENSYASEEPISGTIWAGEGNLRKECGRSPFQSFPVMIWGNRKHDTILLDGTLTQKRLYRFYDVNTEEGKFILYQAPKTVKSLIIPAGSKLYGEWNYLEISESEDLNNPYGGYLAALKNFGKNYSGSKPGNRNELIWGSWNDGIFRDLEQQSILENADFIKEHFPTVKWIQIDDGYDKWDYTGNSSRIGIGIADSEESFCDIKFPKGPKYFTDEVKKRGLRPAIWIGLTVAVNRNFYNKHKDWFLDYDFCPKFRFLDISRDDVREFIRKAFRKFFTEWGFEGIKLDFWSYFFEDEKIELGSGTITGGEYREWFLKTCREFLPEHGYLEMGCDIAMGNVHLAEYADNYRYGIDIGNGDWENFRINAKWAAFCVNTAAGDIFVPNSDSVGLFIQLPHHEACTIINFCLISRTMLEIAGWLYRHPEHPMLPFLQKACCCPKNGERVYFGDFNFKDSDDAPSIWFLKSPHFSMDDNNPLLPERTVAVFNWNDSVDSFKISALTLELDPEKDYLLKDFWNEEILKIRAGDTLVIELDGHHSRLFSVSCAHVPKILDSDTRLDDVCFGNGKFCLTAPYTRTPRLTLNRCNIAKIRK